MSSYGSYITNVMSRFQQLGFFAPEELQTLEAIMTEAANEMIAEENGEPIQGELIVSDRVRPREKIASDFAIMGVSASHSFKVQEGEKVIVHELVCEVIGRDFTNGKVLVWHPFWGEQWLPEDGVIRIQKLFNFNMLKDVAKTLMSKDFIHHFRTKIGQEGTEEIEHNSQSNKLNQDDK